MVWKALGLALIGTGFVACGGNDSHSQEDMTASLDAGPTQARPDLDDADLSDTDGGAIAPSGPTAFPLATHGCAMAHCDSQMTGNMSDLPPSAIGTTWQDTTNTGSFIGIGCSSNGTIAVCSMKNSSPAPAVIAFDATGKHLWDSGTLLDSAATSSAPMVGTDGSAIAADDKAIVRFTGKTDPTGAAIIAWQTSITAAPVSPILLANGLVFTASSSKSSTSGGPPIVLFDSSTGAASPTFTQTDTDPDGTEYYWATANTPSARGNRVYVSMARTPVSGNGSDPLNKGALIAFDVGYSGDVTKATLTQAWQFVFEGPSGDSPMVVGDRIFFDGAGLTPDGSSQTPVYFGIADEASSTAPAPTKLFAYQLAGKGVADGAHDPRGGVWTFGYPDSHLVRLDEMTGVALQTIDLTTLFAGMEYDPGSTLDLVANATGAPALVLGALKHGLQSGYVIEVDVTPDAGSLVWKYPTGVAAGQFPIVNDGKGNSVVVFSTLSQGVLGLSGPAQTE